MASGVHVNAEEGAANTIGMNFCKDHTVHRRECRVGSGFLKDGVSGAWEISINRPVPSDITIHSVTPHAWMLNRAACAGNFVHGTFVNLGGPEVRPEERTF